MNTIKWFMDQLVVLEQLDTTQYILFALAGGFGLVFLCLFLGIFMSLFIGD